MFCIYGRGSWLLPLRKISIVVFFKRRCPWWFSYKEDVHGGLPIRKMSMVVCLFGRCPWWFAPKEDVHGGFPLRKMSMVVCF